MRGLRYSLPLCAWLLIVGPSHTSASSVFRCVDSTGHVTFTRHGCSSEQEQQLQNAYNPTPGSGKPVPLAKPAKAPSSAPATTRADVVVVGERESPCGTPLSGSERREAMIKRHVRAGMTQDDVVSMFGRPDQTSSRNGEQRFQYRDRQGNSRTVNFDDSGCVKMPKRR